MLEFFRRWFQPKPPAPVVVPVPDIPPPKRQPRGIRNNNPGNIRRGDQWVGLVDHDPDGFCIFDTPQHGIRALCIVLRNYERKHRLNTVAMIINRWAPPTENDTGSYIRAVAGALGVARDQAIDVHHRQTLATLCRAIIQHETGERTPYQPSVVMAGVDAALKA